MEQFNNDRVPYFSNRNYRICGSQSKSPVRRWTDSPLISIGHRGATVVLFALLAKMLKQLRE